MIAGTKLPIKNGKLSVKQESCSPEGVQAEPFATQ